MGKVPYISCAITATVILLAGCHYAIGPGIVDPENMPGWALFLEDNFETGAVDHRVWDTGYPWGRYLHGSERAYYTDGANLEIANGTIKMIARREPITGYCFAWDAAGNFVPYYKDFDYTSGMLYGRQPFRYGYFECRFKAPVGRGFNAAFWLYGEESSEIDIFEILGSDSTDAQMTLHWEERDPIVGTRQWPKHVIRKAPSFSGGWHSFGVLWEPGILDWYLDGERVHQARWTRFIRGRHIPDVDMHVIFTLGVGGMDGDPDETTPFPAAFEVDYVRVYRTPATENIATE